MCVLSVSCLPFFSLVIIISLFFNYSILCLNSFDSLFYYSSSYMQALSSSLAHHLFLILRLMGCLEFSHRKIEMEGRKKREWELAVFGTWQVDGKQQMMTVNDRQKKSLSSRLATMELFADSSLWARTERLYDFCITCIYI